MGNLRQPVYLEEKLKQVRESGRLNIRSKSLPTWCPGCGYFSIVDGVAMAINKLQINQKDVTVVSGIGCASRFPFFSGNLRVPYAAWPHFTGGNRHKSSQRQTDRAGHRR